MLLRNKVILNFILFLHCSFANEYLVEGISSTSQTSLLKIIGKKDTVIMFFKPECSACRSQVSELSCFAKSVSKVALGFGGEKRVLWRESKKLKLGEVFGKNIFLANSETKNLFGLNNSYSPQTFVFKKGKVSKHFLGLTDCLVLKKAL